MSEEIDPKRIEKIERRLAEIQRSTKTLFSAFEGLHNELRQRSRLYYTWHVWPYSRYIHWGILGAYIAGVALFSLSTLGYFDYNQQTKAAAGINKMVNYQGKLTDTSNFPVPDANYNIKFSIYNAPIGGDRIWTLCGTTGTPAATAVSVTNGIFSVMLGDSTYSCVGGGTANVLDLDFNTDAYYLGVTVGADDEMSPRPRLGAAGYSYNADTLDGAHGLAYAFLAGRSGGQTLIGGTAANDTLALQANSTTGNTLTNAAIQFKVGDSGGTTAMSILNNGSVMIGDTADTKVTLGLVINQGANDDAILDLKSSDVNHSFTTNVESDTYGTISKLSATAGGLAITGISDTDAAGIRMDGWIGSADPTDTTPAVTVNGRKLNGTSVTAIGANETVFQVQNNDSSKLLTVLGNGWIGIGTASPTVAFSNTATRNPNYNGIGQGQSSFLWTKNERYYTAGIENQATDSDANGLIVQTASTNAGSYNFASVIGSTLALGVRGDGVVATGGTLSVGSNLLTIGSAGIGTDAPGAKLHVFQGEAGTDPTWTSTDVAIFENNDDAWLDMFTPTNKAGGLVFSDTTRARGWVAYDHGTGLGGTADSLRFGTAGSEKMYLDSAGKLVVSKDTAGTFDSTTVAAAFGDIAAGQADSVYMIGNTINGLYGYDSDTAALWINYRGYQGGTTRYRDFAIGNGKGTATMFVDGSAGQVGIGTDQPSKTLHVYGTSGSVYTLTQSTDAGTGGGAVYQVLNDNNNYANFAMFGSGNSGSTLGVTVGGYAGLITDAPNGLLIGDSANTAIKFATNNTVKMSLSGTGLLTVNNGITIPGTADPATINLGTADLYNAAINSAASMYININSGNTDYGNAAGLVFGSKRAANSGGTSIMTINEAGYVGVGPVVSNTYPLSAASASQAAGTSALAIYNDAGAGAGGAYTEAGIVFRPNAQADARGATAGRIYGKYDGSGYGYQRITIQLGNNGGTLTDGLSVRASGASTVTQIHSLGSGTVTSDASGNLSVSSDERLKNIQGAFNAGLDQILTINPILYRWNDQSGLETEHTYAGLSAQNVRDSIPEAVGIDSRGYYTLNDRPLIAALINATKTIQGEITDLQGKVAGVSTIKDKTENLARDNDTTTISGISKLATAKVSVKLEILGELVANGSVKVLGDAEFLGKVKLDGEVTFNQDAAGNAIVAAGNGKVDVKYEHEYTNQPVVTITLRSPVKLDWYRVTNESTTGFTIEISPTQTKNVEFAWQAIAVTPRRLLMLANPVKIFTDRSTSSPVLGQIPVGQEVDYITLDQGWYQLQYNSITGWVRESDVKKE